MADDQAPMDITRLVAEHHEGVYRYAYRLTGSVADAEDLTQQVFVIAQQKLEQLRSARSARNWLFAILRNRFFKNSRKRRPVAAATIQLNVENIPADPPSAEAIDPEALQRALDWLAAPYRVVLTMFYYENCSYREIAEKLDVPIGTVMSRLARAKAHLRATLFGLDEQAETRRDRVKADIRR